MFSRPFSMSMIMVVAIIAVAFAGTDARAADSWDILSFAKPAPAFAFVAWNPDCECAPCECDACECDAQAIMTELKAIEKRLGILEAKAAAPAKPVPKPSVSAPVRLESYSCPSCVNGRCYRGQ